MYLHLLMVSRRKHNTVQPGIAAESSVYLKDASLL